MRRLIIIDGSSILVSSFYGNLPKDYYFAKTEEEREKVLKKVMQTNGVYVNAVYTMSRVILNIIKKYSPSHMAIGWDISRNTFRKELYAEYKGNRDETKPELKSQFILMQKVLREMNIAQYMFEKYEADDVLGTLSKKFEEEIPTIIMTKDQDSLQLVSDHTRVWLVTSKNKEMYEQIGLNIKDLDIPDNEFEFTPLYMEEFYGIKPIQIIDKKALEGDSSDNIPGVKGVGEKAVIPLLQEYSTIENLYANIENMSKSEEKEFKDLCKSLGINRAPLSYLLKTSDDSQELCGKKAAYLSKELATIKRDIPELDNIELKDLELHINKEGMTAIFKELEFKSLL